MFSSRSIVSCSVLGCLAILVAVGPVLAENILLVSSNGSDQVLKYSLAGDPLGVFAGVNDPTGIAQGPDGNVYVAYFDGLGGGTGGIAKYSPTGDYLGEFAAMQDPGGISWGPDGKLYVGVGVVAPSGDRGVFRYNADGSQDTNFNGGAGLGDLNIRGVLTKDNGDGTLDLFYNSTFGSVRRSLVSGDTATTIDTYVGSGAYQGLALGSDDRLYASNSSSSHVFSAALGDSSFTEFDSGATLSAPIGMLFNADGDLLVNDLGNDRVAKFDGVTGVYLGDFIAPGVGGLAGPHQGLALISLEGPGPLPGDLNDDGFVGGDDLDIVRSFWGQNVPAGDLLSGDPSEDGFVGGDDLDIVRANWGQGTPPSPSAVPEPTSVILLVTAGLVLLGWIRHRGL